MEGACTWRRRVDLTDLRARCLAIYAQRAGARRERTMGIFSASSISSRALDLLPWSVINTQAGVDNAYAATLVRAALDRTSFAND
jgi:hypothetical protein